MKTMMINIPRLVSLMSAVIFPACCRSIWHDGRQAGLAVARIPVGAGMMILAVSE
jgi:hypothetical protein